MAIKGKTYYREKTNSPPLFKQVITVLSEPWTDIEQEIIKVKRFNIDYNGFKREIREFGNFLDQGETETEGFIKPIEDVGHEELKDFLICLFENKPYRGR